MDVETPKSGETQAPKAPENGTQTQAPAQGNASDTAAVEQLRKELDQAKMRANQLENEKKAKDEADAKRKAEELEEQNQFKTLYEQEKAKRESIESERETELKRKELSKAKTEVLADYSDEVKALAEEAGMELTSSDEDTKAAFKEKLDKIQKMVGSGKVGANNPRLQSGQSELSGDELKVALRNPNAFEDIISKRPGLAMMMNKRK